MLSLNRLSYYFCFLTYIKMVVFSVLLYKHWQPSWIFDSPGQPRGGQMSVMVDPAWGPSKEHLC